MKEKFLNNKGTEKIAEIRNEMHKAMEEGVGIYRNKDSLTKSREIIHKLKERSNALEVRDKSLTFNTELISAIELVNMLELAETIVESALHRNESRGSHQRSDFVERDDEKYLAHSLAYNSEDGYPKMEYLPVTITKWPPGERKYGN